MSNPQGLWPITDNAPILAGHDATALPLPVELGLQEIYLENIQIPLATQEYQNGKYFHNQLRLLFTFNGLTLWPLPSLIYSLHTDVSG
jgi:hypothetical protein